MTPEEIHAITTEFMLDIGKMVGEDAEARREPGGDAWNRALVEAVKKAERALTPALPLSAMDLRRLLHQLGFRIGQTLTLVIAGAAKRVAEVEESRKEHR